MRHVDRLEVVPALPLRGEVSVPGDKSVSHRLAMIGAVAEGETKIQNFATSADCQSTLDCLRELGAPIKRVGSVVTIQGCGLKGLRKPSQRLNAGNSGTTVRLMCGLLAGFPFDATFVGDESLSRRPMKRIIEPLRQFGARIEAREDNYLPLSIGGGNLHAISYITPVASAQVKSAVLLAGLHPDGVTRLQEPATTRNHTEIALAEFGADIKTESGAIEVRGGRPLSGKTFTVPGDVSSAAFFIAAALAVPGSRLKISQVGLNPSRTGFIELLQENGANITVERTSILGGEPVGDIVAEASDLAGLEIGSKWVPNVIDELPMLAVLGVRTRWGIRIRGAGELRAKESDRIHAVAAGLKALGAEVEEHPDGLYVPGEQDLNGGVVDSFGDHRIAMAFAIAGLFSAKPVSIENPSCVDISFPGFFDVLKIMTR